MITTFAPITAQTGTTEVHRVQEQWSSQGQNPSSRHLHPRAKGLGTHPTPKSLTVRAGHPRNAATAKYTGSQAHETDKL